MRDLGIVDMRDRSASYERYLLYRFAGGNLIFGAK